MEIFRDLNKLGYKHYLDYTIEELDNLDIKSKEFSIESTLAFDWFRKKHKLHSFIYNPIDKINYCFEIKNISEFINYGNLSEMQSGIKYTYEEARLECLKKLIEIVKNK